MDFSDQLRILLDILIAILLGGVLGYERELKEKPAGLRTNMLIAGASALFLVLGKFIVLDMQKGLNLEILGADPTRIIHAIIVGISFIGAGTIVKSPQEESIKYLTTAATILFSAGVGICSGLRLYVLAVGMTALGLFVNFGINKIFTHH